MAEHKNLADAELHEMKGAAAASIGSVPISDGAGSSSWASIPYKYLASRYISDISTTGDAYLAVPVSGNITKIVCIIDGAITVADETLSFYNDGSLMGTITIGYSGAAAGDIDTLTVSTNNAVTIASKIKISSAGASTGPVSANLIFFVEE